MEFKNARDIVSHSWNFSGLETTHEVLQTAALLVIAKELISIRVLLESLGRDGLHEILREQKAQVPALRAERLKKAKSTRKVKKAEG